MKKFLLLLIVVPFIFLISCSNPPTTIIDEAYNVAEFQQGELPYPDYNGCQDANIADGANADNNYSTQPEGSMGYYGVGGYTTRYIVQFDVGSIPSAATVRKAYLTLYASSTGGSGTISCYGKSSGVNIGTVTWNNSSGGGAYDVTTAGTVQIGGAKYYTFRLPSSVVQAWINDSSKNYGLLIKGDDEVTNGWLWCYFAEGAAPMTRPKLTVYYTVN
jgi:hypothetical protein